MKITFSKGGSFKVTERFFSNVKQINYMSYLEKIAKEGVEALSLATPKDSGVTSQRWGYEISKTETGYVISWYNDNVIEGWFNVASGLQYGHGTNGGGWVEGLDYINPALKPIFEQFTDSIFNEVTR